MQSTDRTPRHGDRESFFSTNRNGGHPGKHPWSKNFIDKDAFDAQYLGVADALIVLIGLRPAVGPKNSGPFTQGKIVPPEETRCPQRKRQRRKRNTNYGDLISPQCLGSESLQEKHLLRGFLLVRISPKVQSTNSGVVPEAASC